MPTHSLVYTQKPTGNHTATDALPVEFEKMAMAIANGANVGQPFEFANDPRKYKYDYSRNNTTGLSISGFMTITRA